MAQSILLIVIRLTKDSCSPFAQIKRDGRALVADYLNGGFQFLRNRRLQGLAAEQRV